MKAAKRTSLRKSDFVYPPGSRIGGSQGKYPIDTKKRARAALRYSARSDTAGTYRTVSGKVGKLYDESRRLAEHPQSVRDYQRRHDALYAYACDVASAGG